MSAPAKFDTLAATALSTSTATSARDPIAFTLIGCVMLFLVLEIGATWLAGRIDPTWSALCARAAMLGLALLLERLFFKRLALDALYVLGF